jgi:hypothetical protein
MSSFRISLKKPDVLAAFAGMLLIAADSSVGAFPASAPLASDALQQTHRQLSDNAANPLEPVRYKSWRRYSAYPYYRSYRRPRVQFDLHIYIPPRRVPAPYYYSPLPGPYGNICQYWSARCSANWSRYQDYLGCLRYQGCL